MLGGGGEGGGELANKTCLICAKDYDKNFVNGGKNSLTCLLRLQSCVGPGGDLVGSEDGQRVRPDLVPLQKDCTDEVEDVRLTGFVHDCADREPDPAAADVEVDFFERHTRPDERYTRTFP